MKETAEDANYVRGYCINRVKDLRCNVRMYGSRGYSSGESEGLLYVLEILRRRRNARKKGKVEV